MARITVHTQAVLASQSSECVRRVLSTADEWHIDASRRTCRQLLHHLYAGKLPAETTLGDALALITLANRHGVERLKNQCEVLARDSVAVDTACDVVVAAYAAQAEQLLAFAVAFVQAHLLDVMATRSWRRMCGPDHCGLVELVTSDKPMMMIGGRSDTSDELPKGAVDWRSEEQSLVRHGAGDAITM